VSHVLPIFAHAKWQTSQWPTPENSIENRLSKMYGKSNLGKVVLRMTGFIKVTPENSIENKLAKML
jgi:hypothetical protein